MQPVETIEGTATLSDLRPQKKPPSRSETAAFS
jgi:hypothetical protein